jgi:Putative ATPase subunit of terminase (gpP-like)
MRETQTTKPQTKPPADRESVRVLAIELAAREAARKLGLNENTVLSWARRENWNLPKHWRPESNLVAIEAR